MRRTQKYLQACRVAGISVGRHIPHAKLYQHLEDTGYKWDGTDWRKVGLITGIGEQGSIRLDCSPLDAEAIALVLCSALESIGGHVDKISEPYHNRHNRNVRIYVDFGY